MEFDLGRFTHYPFSVDISNNRLLVALDRSGCIRRAVKAVGVQDVRGKFIPGVYIHKQMAFCEGHIGMDIAVNGRICQTPGLKFAEGVLPVFETCLDTTQFNTTTFVPQIGHDRPLCVIQLTTFTNDGDAPANIELRTHCETTGKKDTEPLDVTIAIVKDDNITNVESDETRQTNDFIIEAHQTVQFAFIADFSTNNENIKEFVSIPTIASALEATFNARKGTLGTLNIPEDPWFGEVTTRASELARQAMLLLDDGTSAGSFWGSNANPLPDVWTRDFGYSTMGVLESDPALANTAIEFLARYGIPAKAWQREAKMHPEATGFEHSLGNACLAIVLASMLVQRHGKTALTVDQSVFTTYIHQLAHDLIASRPKDDDLYETLYISDGPSRGDFHTGSNILAWAAATALIEDFSEMLNDGQAEALADIATSLKKALYQRCVRNICGKDMFVEGVDRNGNVIGVHDGEESDLTLASVYGFTTRDDRYIRNHAQWAHSTDDPYYAPITGGIDFWDFDDSNGITYPGTVHGLCGAGSRKELADALHRIRHTTDLDGSFWWWPFEHAEQDPSRVKRGLGKCGWCAGEFVSFMVHDIAGIRRNEDAKSITVAPYTPWNEFSWDGMSFCGGTINIHERKNTLTFCNNTTETLNTTLQIALQPGEMLEDVNLDGESRRYQAEVVYLRDCAAVRVHEQVKAGQTVTLQVKTRPNPQQNCR